MSYGTPPAAGYGTPPYNQMPQYMMGGAGGAPPANVGPPYGPMHSFNQHGHHAGGGQVPVSSYGNPENHGYGGKNVCGYGQQLHGSPVGGNYPPVPGNPSMGQPGFPQHGFYNSNSPRSTGPGSPYHSFPNSNIRHASPPASGGGGNARHSDMKTNSGGMYGYPQPNVGVGGPSPTSYGYNGFGGGGSMSSPHQDGASGCNPLRSTSPHSPHQNTIYNMGTHNILHQDMAPLSNNQKCSDSSLSPHQPQNASYDFYDKDKAKSPHLGDNKSSYSDNNQCLPGEQSSDNAIKQEGNNFQTSVVQNLGDNTSQQQSNKDNLGNNSPVKNEQQEVPGDFTLIKHETSTDDKVNDNVNRLNNNSSSGASGQNSSEIINENLTDMDNDNNTTVKNENVMANLDSIPDLPEIPELKFSDMQEVGKEDPHDGSARSQGVHNNMHPGMHRENNEYDNQQQPFQQSQKNSITPPMGSDQSTSGSASQQHPLPPKNEYDDPMSSHDIGGGYPNCEMNRASGDSGNNSMPPLVAMEGMQANQEAEFMSMNMSNQHQNMPSHEEAGMAPYQMGMNYGQPGGGPNSAAGGQHMWNYYNNSYPGGNPHMMEGGVQGGNMNYTQDMSQMGPDGAGPAGMGHGWWPPQGTGPGRGPMMQGGGDTSPNYRMPPGIQAPGPWALRGQRSRPDRRGPGRPRLSTSKSGMPQGMQGGPPEMPGQRPRLMSPVNQFPPPFSGAQGVPGQSLPQQDASPNDMMPPSPSSSGSGGGGSGGGRKRSTGRPPRSAMSPNSAAAAMMESNPAAMSTVGAAVASGIPGVGLLSEGKIGKGGSANASKKRYVCEVCQKRFSTAWYVRVHRKSHNGERPYICHNCGKGFMLPNVLQVHLRKCEKNGPAQGGAAPGSQGTRADGTPGDNLEQSTTSERQNYHQQSSPLPQQQQPASNLCMPPHGFPDQSQNQMMTMGAAGNMTGSNTFPMNGNGNTQRGQSGMMHMNNMAYNQRFSSNGGAGGIAGMPTPPFHPNMGDQMYGESLSNSGPGTTLHPELSPHQSQASSNLDNRSPQQFSPMYSPTATTAMSHRSSVGDNGVLNPSSAGGTQHQSIQQSSTNSNVPVHFLANDRPLDKGGGSYDFHSNDSATNSDRVLSAHNQSSAHNSNVNQAGHDLHCSTCDIQFSDKAAFEEHLKSVHRPFACDVCERRFSQKCNLITHQRLHTGERPYPCPQCDKRFTQKGNLDAHLKTHTKEKPYPCTTCGKKFAFKASMLSHVKQAHGVSLDYPPGCGMVPPGDGIEDGLDEIESIKQQLHKYTTEFPPSPSFSPGIPTPQSSLDSLCGNNAPSLPVGHPSPALSMNHHNSGSSIHDHYDPSTASTLAPHFDKSTSVYNNQHNEFKLDHISSPTMSPSTMSDPTATSATKQGDSRPSLVMS